MVSISHMAELFIFSDWREITQVEETRTLLGHDQTWRGDKRKWKEDAPLGRGSDRKQY